MAFTISSGISGLTVEFVSDDNSTGAATLTVASAGTIKWTAPDGTLGDAVTIADGEHKIVADGDDSDKFAVIKRTTASDLSGGPATVTITTYRTTLERLEAVDAQLALVEEAQSTGSADFNVLRARYLDLEHTRDRLERRYRIEQGLSSRVSRADMSGNY